RTGAARHGDHIRGCSRWLRPGRLAPLCATECSLRGELGSDAGFNLSHHCILRSQLRDTLTTLVIFQLLPDGSYLPGLLFYIATDGLLNQPGFRAVYRNGELVESIGQVVFQANRCRLRHEVPLM